MQFTMHHKQGYLISVRRNGKLLTPDNEDPLINIKYHHLKNGGIDMINLITLYTLPPQS